MTHNGAAQAHDLNRGLAAPLLSFMCLSIAYTYTL